MTTTDARYSCEASIDALVQYASGLDNADAFQLQSSFTEDATLDLSKFTSLGMTYPPINGREVIVDVCMKSVGEPLDTSHTLSNFRVMMDEDKSEATITCYAESQHFKKGEGLATGMKENLLVKSRYDSLVVREDNEWRIRRLTIVPVWSMGNVSLLAS